MFQGTAQQLAQTCRHPYLEAALLAVVAAQRLQEGALAAGGQAGGGAEGRSEGRSRGQGQEGAGAACVKALAAHADTPTMNVQQASHKPYPGAHLPGGPSKMVNTPAGRVTKCRIHRVGCAVGGSAM